MNRTDLEALSREQLIELVLGLALRVTELETKLGLPPVKFGGRRTAWDT